MPIYQYQCDECGHLFEKLMKLSDPEPSQCPECGAQDPRRTIAKTAFQLKGSGWYVTDYKGSKPAVGASASDRDSSKTANESSGDATSGDATPGDAISGGEKTSSSPASSETSDPAPSKAQGVA